MKTEQAECSETSAYKIQMPGNHPKESIQQRTYELPEDDMNKIETCWNVFKCFNVNILD